MRIRSFIIAYALVLAILLFADRRPGSNREDRYSHVVDLTAAPIGNALKAPSESKTRIIAPGALIPGTWGAGQIPSERLIAPLVVMDLNAAAVENEAPLSLDDIAAWEARHGMIPQGSVIAIRGAGANSKRSIPGVRDFPIAHDAAIFLIEGRSTIGFALETPVDFARDRTLAQQLALSGNYVVEGTASFTSLPATGSLIIVAPQKNRNPGAAPVRVLAMAR
jgi:kynurenine formamidase